MKKITFKNGIEVFEMIVDKDLRKISWTHRGQMLCKKFRDDKTFAAAIGKYMLNKKLAGYTVDERNC